MIYEPPLPTDAPALIAQIASLEGRRERLRALGRLTRERGQAISQELRDLRGQLAIVQARAASEAGS